MTRVMWDTATPAAIPVGGAGCDATAGYIPGSRYPTSAEIRRRVPNKPHLTIATTSAADAMCLDCEPRYAQPAEAPAWVDRQHARGLAWPVVYCMASWTQQVRNALGNRQYLLWSAHYGLGRAHICGSGGCTYPPADATQWADKGPSGENVDQSLLSDRFWTHAFGQNVDAGDDLNPADAALINGIVIGALRSEEYRHIAQRAVLAVSNSAEFAAAINGLVINVFRGDEFRLIVQGAAAKALTPTDR